MPETITQFNYDERLLDAAATSEQYRLEQEDEARRIAQIEDPTLRGQAQYGSWMRSRREGDFAEFAIQQQEELHDVAHYFDEKAVCSCGLITDVEDEEEEFRNQPGHIQTSRRQVVSLFVVALPVGGPRDYQAHYWCQTCGNVGRAIPNAEGNVSAIGLAAIRKSHKCAANTELIA